MDSKWRILDLTGFEGFLSYERGRIKVGNQSVPLAEVDFILVGQSVPVGGQVRGMKVSDQQWASTLMFVGPKKKTVEAPPGQLMIF